MAAIDFPASPTNGQFFTAATGITYRYASTPGIWVVSAAPSVQTYVGDTPPSNPLPAQLWFNTTLGQLFIWYDDGSTTQWVPANPTTSSVGDTGQYIYCNFGIGSIPVATTVGLGWTVVVNDTGSNPPGGVGGTWTPPAGRWAISGTMSFNNVSAGTGYVRLIPAKNSAATKTLHAFSFQSGEILIIDYNDVVDFNGTDTFEWQAYVDMATNTFDPSSWWTAHKVR